MEVGIPQSLSALEKFLPTGRLSLESNVLDVKLASTSQFNDKDDEGEIMLLAMILLQLHGVKLPSSTTSEEENDLINKKKRQRTSPDQLAILEQIFQTDKMPNPQTRGQLADQLGMSSRRVQIWFQNKRAKVKRSSMKADGSECSSPSSLGDSSSSLTAPESPSSPELSDSSSPSPQSPTTPQITIDNTTRIISAATTTITNAISPSPSSSSKSTPSLTVFTSSTTSTTTATSNDTILADTTKQLKAQQQQFSLKAPFVENQPLLAASY